MPFPPQAALSGKRFVSEPENPGKRMNIGIYYVLGGAALLGASTPLAKILLGEIAPIVLAGLPLAMRASRA
jgi:hypothetical protein